MGQTIQLSQPAELSASTVLVNLGLAALLAAALAWHFIRFGSTFSNRRKFAMVLPAIVLTTVLVISVVKASLALSLGLVGALSIVRFRTPIKEPEELSYLFIAIAIGLGMGADQRIVTLLAVPFILTILSFKSLVSRRSPSTNLYLNLEVPSNGSTGFALRSALHVLREHASNVDLRRYDVLDGRFAGTFYIDCKSVDDLAKVHESLYAEFPQASITFVEQSSMPGV